MNHDSTSVKMVLHFAKVMIERQVSHGSCKIADHRT